jgi:hypothetical protein
VSASDGPAVPVAGGQVARRGWSGWLAALVVVVCWRRHGQATATGETRRLPPIPVVSNFPFGFGGCLPLPPPPPRSLIDRIAAAAPPPSVPSQLTLPRRARLPPCPPSASRIIYTRAPACLPPLPPERPCACAPARVPPRAPLLAPSSPTAAAAAADRPEFGRGRAAPRSPAIGTPAPRGFGSVRGGKGSSPTSGAGSVSWEKKASAFPLSASILVRFVVLPTCSIISSRRPNKVFTSEKQRFVFFFLLHKRRG